MGNKNLEILAGVFRTKYKRWDLAIPEADLAARRAGSIRGRGWMINYHFGSKDGKEFLEFFACHRMTNDTLNRIYEDGSIELVHWCQEWYLPGDPDGPAHLREHNRDFYDTIEKLGLS